MPKNRRDLDQDGGTPQIEMYCQKSHNLKEFKEQNVSHSILKRQQYMYKGPGKI